jgi:hypothetical protein
MPLLRLIGMLALTACNADTFAGGDGGDGGLACVSPDDGGTTTCTTDGKGDPDAGGCTFQHPLLDGGARFCAPGNCYCKWNSGESCYPIIRAAACCSATDLVCY